MPDNPSPVAPAPAAATPSASPTTGNQPTGDATPAREYFDPERHVPKSEFTKLRQRDAQARREAEQQYRQREAQVAAREQQLMQAAYAMQQRMQQGQAQDPYSKIRELPYVDGNTVADLVSQLKNTDLGSIAQAIQQRDRALNFLHEQISELKRNHEQINRTTAESDFHGRLTKVRDSLGLPDAEWATEFLKDIYLSHQGNDLADAFPDMARGRFEAVRKAIRELDKAEAAKAKQLAIPGSGGTASPALRLKEGYKSPKQRANEVWPTLNHKPSDE